MTDDTTQIDLDEQAEMLRYMPWGPAHREAATAVVAQAQEVGDLDAEFSGRMRLTAEGVMSGISDLALANFAWCAAKHAEDPARFVGPADDSSDTIFWQYKWMPGLLMGSPAFSAEQVDAVLADFEATYRNAGLPLSAVAGAKFETAIGRGRVAQATELGAISAATPRDDFSSCAACTPANYVDLALLQGDEAEAIRVAIKTWRDGEGCAEEPESMLARVLIPLLRAGRSDEAVEAYELVLEASRGEAEQVENQSFVALFASLTGNHELALSTVERHLAGLGHGALRERDQLKASLNFAVALDRFAAAIREDAAVRASTNAALAGILPEAERPLRVTEVAEVLWAFADDLAARFDERNGNDYWAGRVAEARALRGEEHPLELDQDQDFAAIMVLPNEPSTPSDWVWRAVDCLWAGDIDAAESAARTALVSEAQLTPILRVRAYGALTQAAEITGDVARLDQAFAAYVDALNERYGPDTAAFARETGPDATQPQIEAALAAYPDAAVGLRLRSAALELRAQLGGEGEPDGEVLAALGDRFAEGIAKLEAELAGQGDDDERYGTALSLASSLQQLGQLRFAQQQPEAAVNAVAAGVEASPSRVIRASLLTMQANMLGRLGATDAAAELFDEAATLYSAAGFVRSAVFASLDAGTAWANAGNPGAAGVRFEYAQSLLRGDESLPMGIQWTWALALIDTGEADRAVPMLEGILAVESADPDTQPGALAQTHFRLGRAYDDSYDRRAGEHYREAVTQFIRDDAPLAAAQAATYAVREFRFQERWDAAVEAAEAGLGQLAANPEPALEFELTKQLATVLAEMGVDSWRARADHLVDVSRQIEDPEAYVDAMGTRVALEYDHGEPQTVEPLARDALAVALAAENYETAAPSLWYLANALVSLDRADEAIALLETYRDRAGEFGEQRDLFASLAIDVFRRLERDDLIAQWEAFFDIA
ncbi:hypothetical protein [Demequina sp.]|uniref:hypothetical protein n=1 Tax=Demequina sp. TaxID=2050685 RepID=UPI003D0E9AFB